MWSGFAENVMADGPTARQIIVYSVSRDRWIENVAGGADAGGLANQTSKLLNTSNMGFQQGRVKDRKVDKDVAPPGAYSSYDATKPIRRHFTRSQFATVRWVDELARIRCNRKGSSDEDLNQAAACHEVGGRGWVCRASGSPCHDGSCQPVPRPPPLRLGRV
jgi:hypothetical protein